MASKKINSVAEFLDKLNESIIDDKVEDAYMELEPFLEYIRVAREDMEPEIYAEEQSRFHDLIDQKLVVAYPDPVARQLAAAKIKNEFPELY